MRFRVRDLSENENFSVGIDTERPVSEFRMGELHQEHCLPCVLRQVKFGICCSELTEQGAALITGTPENPGEVMEYIKTNARCLRA